MQDLALKYNLQDRFRGLIKAKVFSKGSANQLDSKAHDTKKLNYKQL